jgi:arylsulfatase A-like enzyme
MLLSGKSVASERTTRPNIVIILADDQGWGDLSVNGNTNLSTPHIDSLARDGARFDRFFVQPVCSPTRAELLTGRYHPRGGVRGVSTGGERLDLDEKTIADAFRAAGYATGCFGKWHNGSQYPYHPNGRGFDEYYGFPSGHWGEYFDPPLDHNCQPVRGEGYLVGDLTTRAIRFLGENKKKGRASFCYVAYNTPHSPMQVPDRDWRKFEGVELKLLGTGPMKEQMDHTRAALAMCENLDRNVGRLLQALEHLGLADDTIVVYFSDNGPNGPRWNGGMKGRKGSTDEGGVRSPLLVRWPGKINKGTTVLPIAGAIDLYPTLAGLAGVKPETGGKPFDGADLSPLLLDRDIKPLDRVLIQHWAGRVSARSQRHRLDAAGKLYDMVADPEQRRDASADEPAVKKRLADAAERWKRTVLSELPKTDDRPFPVGHASHPATLPARDGVPRAGVKRSAAAPNCSFFTNWRTADDSMTWDVEVATAGRYEAVVNYTCPKADVGASIELTLNKAKWAGKVEAPHDPPLRGREQDRVPRGGESYVKDFRPLSLGVVELPRGRGTLTLRAVKIPGAQVADVRSVVLTLRP